MKNRDTAEKKREEDHRHLPRRQVEQIPPHGRRFAFRESC